MLKNIPKPSYYQPIRLLFFSFPKRKKMEQGALRKKFWWGYWWNKMLPYLCGRFG